MTIEHRAIGSVELLRPRIYALDAKINDEALATTVWVEPGTFQVYRYADAFYWLMHGQINQRGFDKIGNGLFGMNTGDGPSGPTVTFPSRRFGLDEFRELLTDSICLEGDPGQRMRFALTEELADA